MEEILEFIKINIEIGQHYPGILEKIYVVN